MKLSIVIVNWNTSALLLKCLETIYENPPSFGFEVIVVDNASTDNSAQLTADHFPQVSLIRSQNNLGFGAGNNVGIERAHGKYTLLLNPDTEVLGNTLQTVVDYLDHNTNTAVLGVKQREPSQKLQESCGYFPSIKTMFLQSLFDTMIRAGFTSIAKSIAVQLKFAWMPVKAMYGLFDFEKTHDVDWVMGAFMLIRTEILKDVKGFDPFFVMYAEEIDLCYRIKALGNSVRFLPTAEILHHGGASTKSISLRADAMRCVAMIRFYQKHNSVYGAAIYRVIIFSASLLKWLAASAKSILNRDPVTATKKQLALLKIKSALNPTYKGLFSN